MYSKDVNKAFYKKWKYIAPGVKGQNSRPGVILPYSKHVLNLRSPLRPYILENN